VHLLYQALNFDIWDFVTWVWTSGVKSVSPSADLGTQEHIALAHRSAACLYIPPGPKPPVRAASPVNSGELINDIVTHLAFISEHSYNPHFKVTLPGRAS
jgi:hypothetical protein